MDNKRKHTSIENDDDDENYIPKKLKPLVVEEISHDNDDDSCDNVINDLVTVINEYVPSSVELVVHHSERPVAPLDDFEFHEVMVGGRSSEIFSATHIFLRIAATVEEDEFIYVINVVNEHAGHLENVNVIAWNCDPTVSYAYRWNDEESIIRGDDIEGIIIIDLTTGDDETIIIATSSSDSSTVITSSSQQVEYIFNINVDDTDSDDTDSDDSSSTGTIRSGADYYKGLKSILRDQQQLNLNMKLFYSIMKPTVLFSVATDSLYFLLWTYLFILAYLTPGSDTVLNLIKMGSSAVFMALRLFIYCYLFENINIQRELINFSIYSCNWTKMDLKFKKLLLFAMRMNNANQILIRASPRRIINLQLFANILSTFFNMVPVLLKITNLENHKSQ